MMRRVLVLSTIFAVFGACAHLEAPTQPDPVAAVGLGASASIASETTDLNQLIRISIDANRLYDQAADSTNDAELQRQLRAISLERKAFALRLQERVAALGSHPAETGQATGAIYRSFTALRSLVEDNSIAAVNEVYRGETYVIGELENTLKRALTQPSRQMLAAELARVKAQRGEVEQAKSRIEGRDEIARQAQAGQRTAQPDPS